jgi:FxsC-like protein
MSYIFFFSYKRVVDGPYLQTFFDDLSEELSGQLQLDVDEEIGFLDQKGIELGDAWEPTIAQALQGSKVLVCAYSPRYFESEYCGKEWQVFQMRRELHRQKQLAGDPEAQLPPVIVPVLWQPCTPVPAVTSIQYLYGDPQSFENKKGVRSLVKRKTVNQATYTDYIELLAEKIKEAAGYQLPQLANLPALNKVPSAFVTQTPAVVPAAAQPQTPATSTASTSSTKHVRFIFVAGDPAKFGGQRQADAYGERGSYWKPFHPNVSDRIGRLLQHFVSSEEMDFDSDIVEFGQDLIPVVKQAFDERKIVVLLVDGWTVSWDPASQAILRQFDKSSVDLYNSTVLVPWNDSDLEIQNRRDEILDNVRNVFDFRANLWRNPVFYRDGINSLPDLLTAVQNALDSIRSELHKRAPKSNPVPDGISKPVVSNQPPQPAAEGV